MSSSSVPKKSPLYPYEALTAEQLAAIDAFQKLLRPAQDLSPYWLKVYTNTPDVFLVKFLTARKWVPEDAHKMAVGSSRFRIERQLDTTPLFPSPLVTVGWDQQKLEEFQGLGTRDSSGTLDKYHKQLSTVYVAAWHKWDKEGRPLYIERSGKINTTEMVARCKAMVPPGADISVPCAAVHLHSNEVGNLLLEYQNATLKKNPPVVQVSAIMDCDGFSLSQLFGPAMEILKAQTATDQANYPEGMHRLYVVNAPTSLSVAWNIVKGWLDPRVQKKVLFVKPSETKAKLLEDIDESCLPVWLGGTCTEWAGNMDVTNDPSVEDCGLIPTIVVKVKKNMKETLSYRATANTEVVWEFAVAEKDDITVSVTFARASAAAGSPPQVLPEAVKVVQGSQVFTPAEDGVLTFVFDNSHAWMYTKKVSFRVVGATKI